MFSEEILLGKLDTKQFHRATLQAEFADDTLLSVDIVADKTLTNTCGANLIDNVSLILVSEELECCENRVGSCLTETAK